MKNKGFIEEIEEETELDKKYNEVAELYSKAVKKKIEYRKEIERLNNIINQIESIVYADISNIDARITIQEVLDKELKGSDK